MAQRSHAALAAAGVAAIVAVILAYTGHPAVPSGGLYLAGEMLLVGLVAIFTYHTFRTHLPHHTA